MNPHIIFQDDAQLRRSAEYRHKLQTLRETVRARYGSQLATAGFFARLLIHIRVEIAFHREKRNLRPSRNSLHLTPCCNSQACSVR